MNSKFIIIALVMIFILFLLNLSEVNSQTTWERTYGGSGYDYANFMEPTADGGFIIGGKTNSFGALDDAAWILKLNSKGKISWQKMYDGSGYGYDNPLSIREIGGGGFIFTGYTTTFGDNGDMWITKLNSSGNIIWQKIYGTLNWDEGDSIIQTSDNNYVVLGVTSDNLGYYDLWLLKLDTNGNIIWQYTYGGSDDEYASIVRQTSDGGFIIAASTYSFGQGNLDAWILKLDSSGNIIWQKTYGSAYDEWLNWIEQTSDGGYIVAGAKYVSATDYNAWIMKLNSSGAVSWEKIFGVNQEEAFSIQQTSDGGYIVGCSTGNYGAGSIDIWVLKLDSSGNTQWQKTYGDTNSDQVAMVKAVSSGGYIIGGRTFSWGATGLNFLGIKVDQNGNMTPACNFAASTNVSPLIPNSVVADTNVSPNNTLNYSTSNTTFSSSNTNATAPNLCNLCTEPIFDGVQSAFDVDGCKDRKSVV